MPRLCPALLAEEDSNHIEAGQRNCHDSLTWKVRRRGQQQKAQVMVIDTEIRHLTKPGANLFLELGFTAAQAKTLHAASRKRINDTRLLTQQLMVELSTWITEHQLKLADAAQILMVSHPREFVWDC
jgi:predicted XRE-type DNA-binding protein